MSGVTRNGVLAAGIGNSTAWTYWLAQDIALKKAKEIHNKKTTRKSYYEKDFKLK